MLYDAGIVIMRNDNMIQLSGHNFHIAMVHGIMISLHDNVHVVSRYHDT
jgi:hypothetical protein